jgi:chromate transport protein ChrA
MLVTGFALAALVPQVEQDEQLNAWVLAAKGIVITVIFFLAYGYNKKEKTAKWVVPAIAGLTILNICLAVLGPIVVSK